MCFNSMQVMFMQFLKNQMQNEKYVATRVGLNGNKNVFLQPSDLLFPF